MSSIVGINQLIAVAMTKAGNASEEAGYAADKQRDNVAKQKSARAKLRAFESLVSDGNFNSGDQSRTGQLLRELESATGQNIDTGTTRWNDGKFGDETESSQAKQAKEVEDIRSRFDDVIKNLEAEDKLGNFEIQDLMSRYNQAESTANSVLKKVDDTKKGAIQKIA